ncbi:MAG TPA: 4a-hydroxytetrahydrobiopterin dehydratase [Terracidiphilus sp.]|nr:4a-hydroxytetrahydrobiopterin dehydratase [Terracidiphilus sp.]
MHPLTQAEIATRLASHPEWTVADGVLTRTFAFKDFVAALGFVNRVGDAAEAAGHHPDIDIRYNRVRLALVTHDAGGITARDFSLAAQADKLA